MTMLGGNSYNTGRKSFSVDTTSQFINGTGSHGEGTRSANPYYQLDQQTVRPGATTKFTGNMYGPSTVQDDSIGNAWDAIQEQKNTKAWTPPTLVNGNQFQSQQDVDAFKSALKPKSYGVQPENQSGYGTSYNGNPMYTDVGEQNYDAAMKWGMDTGIVPRPSNPSGLPGLHSFNDFMSTWAPIIAIAAPAIAGVAGAAGAAGAAAGTPIEETAGFSAANSSLASEAVTGLAPSSTSLLAPNLSAGGALSAPAAAGIPGFDAGGPGGAGSGGNFDLVSGGSPGSGDLIGSTKALDPIAAPVSEATPVPGFDGGPAAAPTPTNYGDILGKVGGWAKDGLLIGSLIGGLAGLGGKSSAAGEAPPPPPGSPPEATPVQSQPDVKADLSSQMQPGGPLAGNSSTWLTGAGGIPDDQLSLGKQTLLGK